MLPEDRNHTRLRHVPAKAKPSGQATLSLGLFHHALQPLVTPLGLEVGVEPLVVLARLGFEQSARLGIISVVLHALAIAADLVAPALGRARHLGLIGAGLLGHV